MNNYQFEDAIANFTVRQADKITVGGEYEWRLTVLPKVKLDKGTKFVITVQPYQHQLSEEYLQSYDFWKQNYVYALAEEESLEIDVTIKKVKTEFTHINIWDDSCREAHITLMDDFDAGEEFFIQYGGIDRPWLKGDAAPSRVGIKAFNEDVRRIDKKFEIQLSGETETRELPVFPTIELMPDTVHEIFLKSPTLVAAGESFKLTMLAVDRFENPVDHFEANDLTVVFKNLEDNTEQRVEGLSYGDLIHELPVGRYLVDLQGTDLVIGHTVIKVEPSVERKIYWGDTHTHSNLTANIRDNDCGAFPHQAYNYARYVSQLDFVGLSEQTFTFDENRTVNIDQATWDQIGKECDAKNVEGEFVTFCGFELHGQRGDTVVLFKNSLQEEKYPKPNVNIIHDIWECYDGREFITIPHLHRFCNGRNPKYFDNQDVKFEAGFDLNNWAPDSENETMVEVYSAQWGRFEYQGNPMILKARNNVKDNTVVDFLNRGKKWGICANSDGHDGNPGFGGVTGVFAEEQTRASIFDNLKGRQTIASTHPRMFLNLEVDGTRLGNSTDKASQHEILVDVLAPAELSKVELVVDGEIFKRWKVKGHSFKETLTGVVLDDASYAYLRVFQKDKHIGWTSPIWFE